jgi:F-type H+-transporting ATPase subunit delta
MPTQSSPPDAAADVIDADVIDVGARQVGAVYAKAFLAAGQKSGQLAAVVEELESFVAALRTLPKFEKVLSSAIVSHADKVRLLDKAVGGKASLTVLNFLKVVSSHGRLDCLRGIQVAVREQYDAAEGRIPVKLTTAEPLEAGLAEKISASLRTMLGGEPILHSTVQPDLIGGIVLQIGDKVYDGSVATQLEQVRGQMINRSVHEIQSRRDRFRNTTGS